MTFARRFLVRGGRPASSGSAAMLGNNTAENICPGATRGLKNGNLNLWAAQGRQRELQQAAARRRGAAARRGGSTPENLGQHDDQPLEGPRPFMAADTHAS